MTTIKVARNARKKYDEVVYKLDGVIMMDCEEDNCGDPFVKTPLGAALVATEI